MGDLSKNFSRSEFACSCGCGAGNVSQSLIEKLQSIRNIIKAPVGISSGVRCSQKNLEVGGEIKSAHLTGEAADILCSSSSERFKIIEAAVVVGVRRIGGYDNYLHFDVSTSLPSPVMWLG